MHRTISYKESPAPKFDAVEDIKNWFGEKYDGLAAMMRKVEDPRAFGMYCDMGGVKGFPVEAWYDHFRGEGAWNKAWDQIEAEEQVTKAIKGESDGQASS